LDRARGQGFALVGHLTGDDGSGRPESPHPATVTRAARGI
jgi:hypothetical protein